MKFPPFNSTSKLNMCLLIMIDNELDQLFKAEMLNKTDSDNHSEPQVKLFRTDTPSTTKLYSGVS